MLSAIKNKIKNAGIFGKSRYGKTWKDRDNEWYSALFDGTPLVHENFIEFLKGKKDIKTVLEVGCGTGIYPIKFNNLFYNAKYTGVDISEKAIAYCKKNSQFEFICGDFLKVQLHQNFDLVFSHAVIDHVYDIDLFLSKLVKASNKYVYVSSYRGYFPDLNKHRMNWRDDDGCYYNDLSVSQIRKILLENGLSEEEFVTRPQKSGQKNKQLELETVIEINKKNFTLTRSTS